MSVTTGEEVAGGVVDGQPGTTAGIAVGTGRMTFALCDSVTTGVESAILETGKGSGEIHGISAHDDHHLDERDHQNGNFGSGKGKDH